MRLQHLIEWFGRNKFEVEVAPIDITLEPRITQVAPDHTRTVFCHIDNHFIAHRPEGDIHYYQIGHEFLTHLYRFEPAEGIGNRVIEDHGDLVSYHAMSMSSHMLEYAIKMIKKDDLETTSGAPPIKDVKRETRA